MQWNGQLHHWYNSFQATANRRFTGGLFLKGSFTYSQALNEANYGDWTTPIYNALWALNRNKAQADYNRPLMFQLAYAYELPFGPGKKFAQNGAGKAILGGWQINGIFSSVQGYPYQLTASGSSLNMPNNTQTPDQVKPDVAKLGNVGDATFFDTSAFAPITTARFGTVGRNTMRGPGAVNMDLSLFRNFKLTEKLRSEFRVEGFNISNTPHFANPNGSYTSSNFGKITGLSSRGYGDPRLFRFGIRFTF